MNPPDSHYRKCPLTGEKVVIAACRGERPGALLGWPTAPAPEPDGDQACPFCAGNEHETPPPLDAWPRQGPWQVRVTPNKYPAFVPDADPERSAAGSHEVIIETPRHLQSPTQLSDQELAEVFSMYARRIRHHRRQGRWRFVLVFRNQGCRAGASQPHPHSQLAALPTTPARIQHMVQAAGPGVFEGLWRDEALQVAFRGRLVAFCPAASRAAAEAWVMPCRPTPRFEDCSDESILDAAALVRSVALALEEYAPGISYNWILNTAPFDSGPCDHYHWHITFIPRLTTLAGFEWATGHYINPLPPEQAASWLRSSQAMQPSRRALRVSQSN